MKSRFFAFVFLFLLFQKVIRLIPGAQFTWYWYIFILSIALLCATYGIFGRLSVLDGLVFLYMAGLGMCLLSNLILGNSSGFEYFGLCYVLPVGCWAFFRKWLIREEDLERYIVVVSICLSLVYLYDFLSHNVLHAYRLFDYQIFENWNDGRPRGTPYYTRLLFGNKILAIPGITGIYQATGVFYVALFLYHYMCRHVTRFKTTNCLGALLALACGLLSVSGTAYLVFFLVFGFIVFRSCRWIAGPAILLMAPIGALLLRHSTEPEKSSLYLASATKAFARSVDHVFESPLSLIIGEPSRTFGTAIALIDMVFQMGALTYGLFMTVFIVGIMTCAKIFDRIGGGIAVMAAAMILGSVHYDCMILHPINMILFSLVGLASARLSADSSDHVTRTTIITDRPKGVTIRDGEFG